MHCRVFPFDIIIRSKLFCRGIMTRQLRKRTRTVVKEEQTSKTSKYFKKVKVKKEEESAVLVEDSVDVEWVKTLNNKDYFQWIGERTGNIARRWDIPLADDAFQPINGNKLPKHFKYIYLKLRNMRSSINAPVDSVGGSSVSITVAEQLGISKEELVPKNYRLQTLIGIMLSSQTKDEVTAKAMYNITKYCLDNFGSRGISLDAMLQIDEPTLDTLIRAVGFHTRKAKYVTQTCQILVDHFNSEIPTTPEGMMSLPGVGPKMTYLTLQKTWGRMDGICVDVHVDRLCKLFKWVDAKKCKTPNDTREELQKWLPLPLWREINSLLVGYGQAIDRARVKVCELCATEENPFIPGKSNSHNHICPKVASAELLDMVPHMKNYQSWVNYLVKEAKIHDIIKDESPSIDNTFVDNDPPLVKLEDEIRIKPEIKMENEAF
ncbi:similar to Saccharomyces cerevisiae YAL015C NTG1 DNA N-glycosylase and apurinic/apyrimidinic (AP) lyase involved in base excision repair [Maudiozyma saulgeensis]|uniref:Endonuclease III homolog n=1 Tax=Maudiozyma saulgeensis TaxID=1789683 RepID=A0A1X7R792_9SACH|nr:similar to Saccharomyces cerevisiae YAL015C NTG1 DNA N-glycosylase and apurinic/apyrimidinic (AP) lyase involved in base excision repair [Kazachstania saulgeensis]